MHPSSFYDLWARYIYTSLHGPYSLSEALEGLISYPLNESQDSISISSKRSLRHELILELSNVVDDLQGYLVYFSSQFLISPSNSLDLEQELRASHDRFRCLSICWEAIVTRIAIARGIVEHDFWPHLFQPAISNLAPSQRFGQPPAVILPNASYNKSPMFTSAFSPLHMNSTPHRPPHSPYWPLESRRLRVNEQSECPEIPPSKAGPRIGARTSFSRLDSPSAPFGSLHSRIPSNRQPSDTFPQSCLPQVYKDCLNDICRSPNHSKFATHCTTSAQASDMRELENLRDKAEVGGA